MQNVLFMFFELGFDLLPNDQGYGYHGRLLEVEELGILTS